MEDFFWSYNRVFKTIPAEGPTLNFLLFSFLSNPTPDYEALSGIFLAREIKIKIMRLPCYVNEALQAISF